MILSRMVLEFLIFSIGGWVFESILGIVKTQKWEKRGFLYGPVCPIYGVGACGALTLARLLRHTTLVYTWWEVFLVAFFGSAILEYATSLILENLFHAYWWDYSDMPLNINGRICLPASTLFGCTGVFIVYILLPRLTSYELHFPELFYEFIAMVIVALYSVDITLTASALTNFASAVDSLGENLNQHMEAVVDGMSSVSRGAVMRVRGFRFRPSESGRKERMERALEMIRRKNMLQYAKAAGKLAKDTAIAAGTATKEKAIEVGTATKEKAIEVGTATKERAIEVGTATKEKAFAAGTATKERAIAAGTATKERAIEVGTATKERAIEVRTATKEKAIAAGSATKEKMIAAGAATKARVLAVGQTVQEAGEAKGEQEPYLEMVQGLAEEHHLPENPTCEPDCLPIPTEDRNTDPDPLPTPAEDRNTAPDSLPASAEGRNTAPDSLPTPAEDQNTVPVPGPASAEDMAGESSADI